MSKIYYFVLALLICSACGNQVGYVIRGTVPGAIDSTEISLEIKGERDRIVGYVVDEKFELYGSVERASLCELRMNDNSVRERTGYLKEQSRFVDINFFIENGKLIFRTPHIDSLPKSFFRYDIRKEKNYTLTGSPAQDIYFRYQQQTISLRHAVRSLERSYTESSRIEDYKKMQSAQQELERQTRDFIKGNKNVDVNLVLAERLKKEPFTYNQAYLDGLGQLFVRYQDTCRVLENFRQYLQNASVFVQGKPLQDANVLTINGDSISLLDQLKEGGYTMIDFWASWCGPCRASFPHLQKMCTKYGDKIKFLSISVDKEEKKWLQAVDEEKLPWSQLFATRELVGDIGELYGITGVPTFLLIDPAGKIIFSGHNSGELEIQLDELYQQ